MRTNTAATLYNKVIVAGAETYRRTPIVAVEWEQLDAATLVRSGMLEANVAVIYIPLSVGANHLEPKAWQALTVKTGKWTLQSGDYLVKGIVADEITTAFTLTALKAKYDDVVKITGVHIFDMGSQRMRHWQVSAS